MTGFINHNSILDLSATALTQSSSLLMTRMVDMLLKIKAQLCKRTIMLLHHRLPSAKDYFKCRIHINHNNTRIISRSTDMNSSIIQADKVQIKLFDAMKRIRHTTKCSRNHRVCCHSQYSRQSDFHCHHNGPLIREAVYGCHQIVEYWSLFLILNLCDHDFLGKLGCVHIRYNSMIKVDSEQLNSCQWKHDALREM